MKIPKPDRDTTVLFMVSFFVGMSLSMTVPILPEIRSEFNLTYSTAALVLSSFGFARLLLTLPSGYLYGRIKKKYLLSAGIAALGIGSLMAGMSSTFIEFIIAQVIMGAGFSVCLMVVIVSLSIDSTKKNRGSILGMNTFARTASMVVSPAIAGFITVMLSWRHVFYVYALITLVSLFLVLMLAGDEKKISVIGKNAKGNRFNLSLMAVFLAVFATFFVGAGFRNTIMPLYSKDVLNLDVAAISLVMSVAALVHLFAGPLSAFLSDRHGRKFFLSLGMLLTAIGVLSFLFISDLNQLLFVSVIFGVGTITYVIPVAMIGDMTANAKKDFSIMRFVSELSFVAGPLVLGVIADFYGFRAAIILTAIVAVASLAAIEIFVKEQKHHLNWKKVLQLEEE